ncbi:hypothetical protein SBP28_005300 [Candidozyma auris]
MLHSRTLATRCLHLSRTFSMSSALLVSSNSQHFRFASQDYKENNKFASSSGNGYDKTRHNQRNKERDNYRRTRIVRFNFESGSDQAKLAVKDLIKQVQAMSPTYKVQVHDPETRGLTVTNFADIVNSTDFSSEGLSLLPPSRGRPGQPSYPIIKKVKIQEMLTQFSETLAARKQQELLEMGSSAAMRSMTQRQQAERKKSSLKIVPLSWSISIQDLCNQKYNEIARRVKKQDKFFVYLGDKNSLQDSKKATEKERLMGSLTGTSTIRKQAEDSLEVELRKRERVVEKVREILAELDCPYEESGSVDTRAAFHCSPKKIQVPQTSGEMTEKEQKKQKRAAKEKDKDQQKSKVVTDDLDSLYSFKIED